MIKSTALLLGTLLTTACFAQSGAHGAGTAVYKNDQLMLRDLADKTVCTYHSTETLYKEFQFKQRVDEILTSLHEIHPYMAWMIRREMAQLKWCLTTDLYRVSSNDAESITANFDPQVQVAIRDIGNREVYLDGDRLQQLPLDHQAMTIIHETLHTWIAPQTPNRNANLRGLSKMIYENYRVSKMKNQPLMQDRISDMNVAISATGTGKYFKSVEEGQLFGKAITSPKQLSPDEVIQISKNNWLDLIANQFGAVELLQTTIEATTANGNNLNPFLAQYSLDEASLWINNNSYASHLDLLEIPHESIRYGRCTLERDGTASVLSAGFLSTNGYTMDIGVYYKLTLANGEAILARLKQEYTNHTVLFAVPAGKSIKNKSAADIQRFNGTIASLKRVIKSGACDFDGPELKNFY